MELIEGTELAKQALENARTIVESSKRFGDIQFERRAVDLESQVAELGRAFRTACAEKDDLSQVLELRRKTTFRNPYWYEEGDEVPLCPKCYESSEYKMRIHLTHPAELRSNGGHRRICKTCQLVFWDEGAEPPSRSGPVVVRRSQWL
jgi:hypothetical protein